MKVEEIAGFVGLQWALNAGGVITRSVHSLPDEDGGDIGRMETGRTNTLGPAHKSWRLLLKAPMILIPIFSISILMEEAENL